MSHSMLTIQLVWQKATPILGRDQDIWRKDKFGSLIHRHSYGMQSDYGWHIDHIYPDSKGGPDVVANYQPLQWKNNIAKSDKVGLRGLSLFGSFPRS
ncbi:hypothetical protein WH96_06605 [Kiloniella spongiae]|uniref:HNH domain-containing protein n=1 Tax=Kiloniella spongiae TaxID=1489064 RepID=A0A0H2MKN4_9PROT|nr:HNH endonuclease [Kiloniella spongiae]KLN61317.1 hypothetical protein WH96_06605 [Kiloniella spongiae]